MSFTRCFLRLDTCHPALHFALHCSKCRLWVLKSVATASSFQFPCLTLWWPEQAKSCHIASVSHSLKTLKNVFTGKEIWNRLVLREVILVSTKLLVLVSTLLVQIICYILSHHTLWVLDRLACLLNSALWCTVMLLPHTLSPCPLSFHPPTPLCSPSSACTICHLWLPHLYISKPSITLAHCILSYSSPLTLWLSRLHLLYAVAMVPQEALLAGSQGRWT